MTFPWKLVRITQERTNPVRSWIPLALVFGFCGARAAASFDRSDELFGSGPPLGAWVRTNVWAVFALLALPLLLGRAAGIARRFQRADSEWLAPCPLSPWVVELALLAGIGSGALLLVALAAGAAEISCPTAPGLRFVGRTSVPPAVLPEGAAPFSFVLEAPPPAGFPSGARIRVSPMVAPGSGPAVSVRASLSDAEGGSTSVEKRIHGRATLEIPLPRGGAGPLGFTLERSGPGAVLVFPDRSVDILVETSSDRWASLELGLRAWLALAAWMALAAGLGAWMRPTLATLLSLAGVAHAGLLELARAFLPGGDLRGAWDLVGQGIVPPPLSPALLVPHAGGVLVGLLLLHFGLRARRSP